MTIPQSLCKAVVEGRLIPFVGSGASMDVKPELFPSWEVLLQRLAAKLRDEADEDSAEIVLRQLKKKQLNKAADEAIDALKAHHFHQVMKSTFEIDRPIDANLALPQAIWSLKPSVVVTTNYERVLEWGSPASKFVVNSQRANLNSLFQESTADSPKVWHLHGHISDPDSLILAPKQYEEFYRDAKHDNHLLAHAHSRLRSMISQYPMLFIGFGLRDEYVLDALETVLKIFGDSLQPSYALLKQGDDRVQILWKRYNVHVIPYADHGQPLVDKITEIRTEAEKLSMGGLPDETVPQPIPDSYIQWLRDQCVDITPFGMAPTDGQSVSLQQVYVPPVTMPRIVAEELGMDDAGEPGDVGLRGRKQREKPKMKSPSFLSGNRRKHCSYCCIAWAKNRCICRAIRGPAKVPSVAGFPGWCVLERCRRSRWKLLKNFRRYFRKPCAGDCRWWCDCENFRPHCRISRDANP